MELSEILAPAKEKRLVECHPDEFARLVGTFQYLDSNNGRIDFNELEAFYYRSREKVGTPTRIKVFDDGSTIVVDGKRVEGLTTFQTSVLAYLATHGRCTVDRLLDAVWKKPDGEKRIVGATVARINERLESNGIPCFISKNSEYFQIIFLLH